MLRAGEYYWRWARTAWSQSLSQADLIAGFAGAGVAAIDHYYPEQNLVTAWAWQIPLWVLAAVATMRIVAAPFIMAKEDFASRPVIPEPESHKGPNLYIWDAFVMLDPDLTRDDYFPNYEWQGNQIRDWLSTGQIRSWGRRLRGRRQPSPLMEIPNAYWHNAKFTYSFLNGGADVAHVRPDTKQVRQFSYTEVTFNRAEFERMLKIIGVE